MVCGITLLTVHPEDLTLQGMKKKVGHLLPLRDLCGHEPLIGYLESVSRSYRRVARGGKATHPPTEQQRTPGDQQWKRNRGSVTEETCRLAGSEVVQELLELVESGKLRGVT